MERRKMFDNPISNIMRKHFTGFKIDKEAKSIVIRMMSTIHAILMNTFEGECESSSNSVLRCVQVAVSKSLPMEIRRHALAEASKKLLLFQKGKIAYNIVSSSKCFTPISIFKDGLKTLASRSTGATLAPQFSESDKRISEILSRTIDFISTKVANYSRKQNLTEIGEQHVKEVMKEMFPKNLFEHANLHVCSRVRHFEKDLRSDADRKAPKRKRSGGKSLSRKRTKSVRQPSKRKKYSKRRQPSVSEAKSVIVRGRKRTVSAKKSAKSKSRTGSQGVSPKRRPQRQTIRKYQKSVGSVRIKSRTKSPKAPRATGRLKPPFKHKPTRRLETLKALDFSKGISEIFKMLSHSPSASVGLEARESINSFMVNVFNCLLQESAILKSPTTAETVRSAVDKFLPCIFARHAIAHANQKIGILL